MGMIEDIDDAINESIPPEVQELMAPVLANTLGELIASFDYAPTNRMLIEQLGLQLGHAASSYQENQVGNREWLKVAVMALRIYADGTPDESRVTRKRLVSLQDHCNKTLTSWAQHLIPKVKKQIDNDERAKNQRGNPQS